MRTVVVEDAAYRVPVTLCRLFTPECHRVDVALVNEPASVLHGDATVLQSLFLMFAISTSR